MLRLLIDHDLDQDILRGLLRRVPDLDSVTAYEIGMSEAPDPELLAWAAEARCVLVTHDRRTMPAHPTRRLAAGDDIAGAIAVSSPHALESRIPLAALLSNPGPISSHACWRPPSWRQTWSTYREQTFRRIQLQTTIRVASQNQSLRRAWLASRTRALPYPLC